METGNIRIKRALFDKLQALRGFTPWDIFLEDLLVRAETKSKETKNKE